jgi:hypothetical protein
VAEEKAATQKANATIITGKLERILGKLPAGLSRSVRRGQFTGAWLTVLPFIVSGTELSAEFYDALIIRYGELPSNFPQKCDGCDAHFTLQHAALACKKGGLVIFRCNEV